MNRISSFMCCSEDVSYEEPREMELMQGINHDAIPSLDGSNHWKQEDPPFLSEEEQVKFIFGGSASSWLSAEPLVFSDENPDSILVCDEDEASCNAVDQDACASCDQTSGESGYHRVESQDLLTAEEEIDTMIQSTTDPVGKFLRQHNISARRAVELNIHHLLLRAPKTPRQKYGPRHEQTAAERMQLCKDRNRAHAKATRQRKKLFEQILQVLERRPSEGGGSADCEDGDEMSEAYSHSQGSY